MIRQTTALLIFLTLFGPNLSGQNYERYKKLADTTLHSQYLGFNKNISITVPVEWQKDQEGRFPLLLVFDRQNPRSHQYMLNTIDYLTSNEQMPSCIVVSIESADEYRALETLHKASSEKGLAHENEAFLFEELIPLLEKNYKASPFRVFVGHSRYGYFTTSLLPKRVNDLNAVIAISPFFSQKNVNLIDSISTLKKQNLTHQKYFRFGIGGDFPTDFRQMDSLTQALNLEKFNAKGYLFPEADHNVTPGLSIGTSLYEVFEMWAKNQNRYLANTVKDVTILDSLEKATAAHYGHPLKFSLGALNGKGWFFYGEEQYEKAIQAWEILLATYPNFSEGYLYLIDAQMQLKKEYAPTVEKLKTSLKSSDFYSKKEKKEIMKELKEMTQ